MEVGGAEKQLLLLAGKLKEYHYNCVIFSLQKEGPLKNKFYKKNIRVYDGGLGKGDLRKYPWKIVGSAWKLIRTIKKERPQSGKGPVPSGGFI